MWKKKSSCWCLVLISWSLISGIYWYMLWLVGCSERGDNGTCYCVVSQWLVKWLIEKLINVLNVEKLVWNGIFNFLTLCFSSASCFTQTSGSQKAVPADRPPTRHVFPSSTQLLLQHQTQHSHSHSRPQQVPSLYYVQTPERNLMILEENS